jgi:predicted RNA methylase
MNKQLDLAIIKAIESIISEADCDVIYTIHKATEKVFLSKKTKEVTNINITLTKNEVK